MFDWFPSVINAISAWFQSLGSEFYNDFIFKDRWHYMLNGLVVTLEVTIAAVIIGIILGFLVAIVRSTHDKTGGLKFLNGICRIYLTVIRGTPVMVQLLIVYFVIFGSVKDIEVLVAIMAFGVNSGAYVAEIFRSGIISIDNGQFEAGRSLGFNYNQTMWTIIMPQAIKNVVPALLNEVIALLKETAIVGYISLQDVTRGAMIIRGVTYDPYLPLLLLAVVYLCIVLLLSLGVHRVERRLMRVGR